MSKLPVIMPSGQMLPHLSARRRAEIVDTVFEMVGGVDRLAHEVNRNSDSYMAFVTKVWAKGLPRVSSNEHTLGGGVEDLLDRLDEEDRKSREQQVDLVETSPGHFEAEDAIYSESGTEDDT